MSINILLCSGFARSGKNTFATLVAKLYPQFKFKEFSFAHELKQDLAPLIKEKFNWDIFSLTDEEKSIIRPIMIAYGVAKRQQTGGMYWVNKLDQQIDFFKNFNKDTIPIITDLRYYQEARYYKEKYSSTCLTVEIIRENGPIPPEEEVINQPLVRPFIDQTIIWPTVNDKIEELSPFVKKVLDFYF